MGHSTGKQSFNSTFFMLEKKDYLKTLNKKLRYKKDGVSFTFHTFRVRNANLYSCSRGTLLSQAFCKLNMLRNLMKPKYIINTNKIELANV